MTRADVARDAGIASWEGRRVVVVGAGSSGAGAARLLLDFGAKVTVTDTRSIEQLAHADELIGKGAEIVPGGHPPELWLDADIAVFSPGIRPDAPVAADARRAGVDVIGEIDVAADLVTAPVIAITGSNGKSTVTSMVGEILAEAGLNAPVCGNIGTAFCDAARPEILASTHLDAYVVEISSFQAHYARRFHPRIAAILNIQPDHVDWHGSFDAYAAAKMRLTQNMNALDWLVYSADDEELSRRVGSVGANLMPFGRATANPAAPSAWVGDDAIWLWPRGGERTAVLPLSELEVIGPHNQANACAAAAMATLFGISPPYIATALSRYRALEHRMEDCGDRGGVRCINDSKATNVDATIAALSGFDHGVWLILGGRDKGADFGQLLPLLDGRIERTLLIGEAAGAIENAIGPEYPVENCGTLEEAVSTAFAAASPGATLLLSPACTSFDQYPNFEERGRHFKALVDAHGAGHPGAPAKHPMEDS